MHTVGTHARNIFSFHFLLLLQFAFILCRLIYVLGQIIDLFK